MTMTISRAAMDALRTLACSFGVPLNFFRCKLMAELDRCTVVEPPQTSAIPAAWLHAVTQGDGSETDSALSFASDNFPLSGELGFRSLGAVPLYTAPPASAEAQNPNHAECCAIAGGNPALCDCVNPRLVSIPTQQLTSTPALREVTTEDIERAARAICLQNGWNPDERVTYSGTRRFVRNKDRTFVKQWELHTENARAALESFRARLSTAQGVPDGCEPALAVSEKTKTFFEAREEYREAKARFEDAAKSLSKEAP